MAGDLSLSAHSIQWIGTTTNRVITIGEEVVFPGNAAAYLRVADHADWTFDGDFTIEEFGWKTAAVGSTQVSLSHYRADPAKSWHLVYSGAAGTPQFRFDGSTDGSATTNIGANWTPTANQAYDRCVDRSGSTVRLYIDGVMIGSGTLAGALFNSAEPLVIGGDSGAITFPFNGRMKAWRITKGVARYATDTSYTVPSLPLPTS